MYLSSNNSYRGIRPVAATFGLVLLFLHFYFFCYTAFDQWELTSPLLDRIAGNLDRSGLFHHRVTSKLIILFFLALTFIGHRPSRPAPHPRRLIKVLSYGFILYLGSEVILWLTADPEALTDTYILFSLSGLILLYKGAAMTAGLLYSRLSGDIFNRVNESFPQEERLLSHPYSINLQAQYTFRNQQRNSYVNLIDIYRGTLIMGTPGSGKTRYIFREAIRQSLANGMALFVYDLKYDDLTRLTYNTLQQVKDNFTVGPAFYSFNFDDFSRSHRCNLLDPAGLEDIIDAAESARTILFALNRKWIHQQGEFFVESAVSFFTANIWFLRKYEDGRYCTLPHLIELIQTDYNKLFSILRSYPEIETLIGSFVSAYTNSTMEQLQGQVDSARIPLSALASPELYYLLSANDFTLDINNPQAPKVICIASNPQKQMIYGAIISLFVTKMIKLVNRKGGIPSHLFFDEFPSFYANGMDITLATARSNKVAITLGIQDLSQLRKEYGRDHADALFNLPGNLISGQVTGDSARLVSERFGKILQEKNTISTNSRNSSTSQSHHLDLAVPASKIATLSSGEFVGFTADTPSQPIRLKGFHCRIQADHSAIEEQEKSFVPIPVVRQVTPDVIQSNFSRIKADVSKLVSTRLKYLHSTPDLIRLIVTQKEVVNHKRQSPD